jgi:TonB family protein
MRHISKNFHYPEEAQMAGIQGQVSAIFTINQEGTIEHIKTRGPHDLLEGEVKRIIERLPNMLPGRHHGKAVAVPYSIPITFALN